MDQFEREAKRILAEVEKECGWMYETLHTDGKTKGRINYTVWSDVFICPYCKNDYIFWEAAVDQEAGKVKGSYGCPTCKAEITKRECERAWVTFYDQAINQEVTQAKQVPVMINYLVRKKRYEKEPEQFDLDLIKKIEESVIPYWFPTDKMPEGYNTEQPKRSHGIIHAYQFYTKRNLWVISAIVSCCINKPKLHVMGAVKSGFSYSTKMIKVNIPRLMEKGGLFALGSVGGTLYIPSISAERPIIGAVKNKIKTAIKVSEKIGPRSNVLISTNSAHGNFVANNSVDYIFTDPPFGGNLMYSELNFLWETWLKVFTNNRSEAIVNAVSYTHLNYHKQTKCWLNLALRWC